MLFADAIVPVSIALNWNTIIVAVIGLVGTGLSGVIAIFMAKMAQSAVEMKRSVADTAVSPPGPARHPRPPPSRIGNSPG